MAEKRIEVEPIIGYEEEGWHGITNVHCEKGDDGKFMCYTVFNMMVARIPDVEVIDIEPKFQEMNCGRYEFEGKRHFRCYDKSKQE